MKKKKAVREAEQAARDAVILPKEEAAWTTVRDKAQQAIDSHQIELEISWAILDLAEKKIEELE